MNYLKHGIIWAPNKEYKWSQTHATCPTPVILGNGVIRVYCQTRDAKNVGRVTFVDLDPENPRKILGESNKPVLEIGERGLFDDNGVFQTSVVKISDEIYFMYYVGFELGVNVRYRLLTGLAVSEDGGNTFRPYQKTPILERSPLEPMFRAGPFVIKDGNIFKMWYVAGSGWEIINGVEMPIYDIRYIESLDGIHWPDSGLIVLPISETNEHGFGRPYIIKTIQGYKMHYSIRRRSPLAYCLGFATSDNGIEWQRKDNQILLSNSDAYFENISIEYAAEFSLDGKEWILYNGNDFGRDGFCLAERID